MSISSQHVTGFVVGLGAAAAGFYFYKKNQKQVDEWLRQRGISLPNAAGSDPAGLSLEELVREKERLEDLIAEREMAPESPPEDAPKAGAKKRGRKSKAEEE